MATVRLATKNLLRSPKRTVLTAIALIAGVGIYVFGEGFVSGTTENIKVSAIDGSVGHVTARPADYPTLGGQHPVDELLALTPGARALLDQEAVAWTERLYFAPTATSGADSLRVVGIGYDPARDEQVFPRALWRVRGALPDPARDEVTVSNKIAKLLRLEPGSRLVLQVRTHQGAINALEVTVSGVVTTGNIGLDANGVLVPRPLAQKLVATELPSHLTARLRDRDDSTEFAPRLAAALGAQSAVVTWQEETRELVELQAIRQKALDMVMFVMMALAALGIANTILMAAYERVREVGTLRSLGMTEGGVVRLFMLEGALTGLLGSALGALWGGLLVRHFSLNPIDFSRILEKQGNSNLSISGLVYTRFEPSVIALAILIGVLVSVLASIYPARVASGMAPADAVRAQ